MPPQQASLRLAGTRQLVQQVHTRKAVRPQQLLLAEGIQLHTGWPQQAVLAIVLLPPAGYRGVQVTLTIRQKPAETNRA